MSTIANVDPANVDLSALQMQTMGEVVLKRVVAHLAALPDTPSCGDFSDIEDLCRSMREGVPERGAELQALLDPLLDEWIQGQRVRVHFPLAR